MSQLSLGPTHRGNMTSGPLMGEHATVPCSSTPRLFCLKQILWPPPLCENRYNIAPLRFQEQAMSENTGNKSGKSHELANSKAPQTNLSMAVGTGIEKSNTSL